MKTPDIFSPMAEVFASALGRPATIRDANGVLISEDVDAILRVRDEEDLLSGEGPGAVMTRSTVAFRTADAPGAADDWTIEDSADGAVYTMHNLADDGRGMTRGTLRR